MKLRTFIGLLVLTLGVAVPWLIWRNANKRATATPVGLVVPPRFDPQHVSGVFAGTLGNAAVKVCFELTAGRYYYLRYLKSIALEPVTSGGQWREMASDRTTITGLWKITSSTANELTGTWQSPDGTRSLPMTLRRVPTTNSDELACATLEFYQERVDKVPITRGPAASVEGIAYASLLAFDGEVSGVELLMAGGDYTKVNARLRHELWRAVAACFNCQDLYTESGGRDRAEYQWQQTPKLAGGGMLTLVAWNEGSCGGPHPFNNNYTLVLDRNSGEVLRPERWLRGDVSKGIEPSSDLGQLLLRRYPRDDKECREVVAQTSFYSISPAAGGLQLTPSLSHAVAACADPIFVPYNELTRFLSDQGREAVAKMGMQ